MTNINHWSNHDTDPALDARYWSEYFFWQAAKYFKEHPEDLGPGPDAETVKRLLQEAGMVLDD